MSKDPSTGLPDGPLRRRRVLIAYDWPTEATKRGIVDYARRRGWCLLDLRCYSMQLPRFAPPDGILFGLPEDLAPLVRELLGLGAPAVEIEDYHLGLGHPHVIWDRRAIGRAGAAHFAERGFSGSNFPVAAPACTSPRGVVQACVSEQGRGRQPAPCEAASGRDAGITLSHRHRQPTGR